MTIRTALIWLSMMVLLSAGHVWAQPATIAQFAVHAGSYSRSDTPVSASLDSVPLHVGDGDLQLFEITRGQDVPVASQLVSGDPMRLVWILSGKSAPGAVRNFELRRTGAESGGTAGDALRVSDSGESIRITAAGEPVLAYRYVPQPVPEGADERYSRSGFIHPLWTPEGEVLTRIQPPDHLHHYGIWNPWTSTVFEGREIDFWNLAKGQGTVRAKEVLSRMEGPVMAGFRSLLEHVDLSAPQGGKVALREQWDVTALDPGREDAAWMVDFVSTLSPATDAPLTIKAYRYQGFGFRAVAAWEDETATLRTSEGFDKRDANATRARWVDVRGPSDAEDGTSGLLLMTHPTNRDYPELLRIWPVGANNGRENVFVNFNPAQERDWMLRSGTTERLKYRLVAYDGSLTAERAEQYWRDFAHPPRVDVFPVGSLQGKRVLVYTRNGEGYVHDNLAASVDAIRELGAQHGFEVEWSEDPAVFEKERLADFDAIIFSNTNNEAFATDAQRKAFQEYVRGGGGVVGIHSASGSERDWPWFSRLIGGNFVRHPPRQDFTVEVVDRAHPSTAFLPDRWQIEDDECYYMDELSPGIRVLLAVDLNTVTDEQMDEYPGDTFGDRFPLAWFQQFDGGRQFYTALGHRIEHYQDPLLMRHILGGIQYVIE